MERFTSGTLDGSVREGAVMRVLARHPQFTKAVSLKESVLPQTDLRPIHRHGDEAPSPNEQSSSS
jgi:hypothetical protein